MKWLKGWMVLWMGIVTLGAEDRKDLYTNVYVVPPTFLNGGPGSSGWKPIDPFEQAKPLVPRKTAKEILQNAGIVFGEGASAIYNPKTSQLIVRNTQDQMELVEAYIESLRSGVEKQIYVTIKEVVVDAKSVKEEDFGVLSKPKQVPGRLGGTGVLSFRNYGALLEELSRAPQESRPTDGIARGIAGVFTGPQFQLMIRELAKRKEFEMLDAPSIMLRSNQPGMSQLEKRRYAIIPTIGADEFTIDLKIYIAPVGKPLFRPGDDLTTPYQLTIWDGQAVALAERDSKGEHRVIFVKAQLMDPAGMPIHPKGGLEEQKEDAKPKKNPRIEKPEPPLKADPKPTVEVRPAKPDDTGKPGSELTAALQERVKQADENGLRGSQLHAEDQLEKALAHYEEALSLLPDHPVTEPRRRVYAQQAERIREKLGEKATEAAEDSPAEKDSWGKGSEFQDTVRKADEQALKASRLRQEGQLEEAREVLEGAILLLPDHSLLEPRRNAYGHLLKTIVDELDHVRWPSSTSFGIYRVRVGDNLAAIAQAYDTSVTRLQELNRLEGNTIAVGQLLRVPISLPRKELKPINPFEEHLNELIIAEIDFRDLPLTNALGNVLTEILDVPDRGLFPDMNPKLIIDDSVVNAEVPITLRLRNIPATEALRYITALAQCRYRVEGETILVEPLQRR